MTVFFLQGWYIVTYALAIYHLNLLLAFLTPKIDPAMAEFEAEDEEGLELPTKQSDEFRPFIRRLPGNQRSGNIATVCRYHRASLEGTHQRNSSDHLTAVGAPL